MRALRAVGLTSVLLAALVGAAARGDSVEEFVARHWRAPLGPQGPAPAHFTPAEAALDPAACGACHPQQLADWRTSLHAASMGPGVMGQLVEMREQDPAGALGCQTCHAPLAEQAPVRAGPRGLGPNPAFDPALRAQGLVCAACHVRAHQRFGPPRRDGSVANTRSAGRLPHDGATRTPAFLRSEFCRGCHQFAPDGVSLNGKLLENTYAEWQASPQARRGVHCQDCHMPDRRHLWRGIHDPEMVRGGLTITLREQAGVAILRVENTGVGHAFPTYVTPLVLLRGERLDAAGAVVPGSRRERRIGREVELDLSREIADTRLGPGGAAELRYARPAGARVRLSVVVLPDAFYTRFFEALLRQGAGRGEREVREALEATRRSPFTVFTQELGGRAQAPAVRTAAGVRYDGGP
jgi:hypothetical protein